MGTEKYPTRDDYHEYAMWECQCQECGEYLLTDEWMGNAPYFSTRCECGGDGDTRNWQVSREPHPEVWGL